MTMFKKFLGTERRKTGCYVSCDYDLGSSASLAKWCADHLIPQPLAPEKHHTTVLYSREDVPSAQVIVSMVSTDGWEFKVKGFDLFDSKEDPDKRSLVLMLHAPQLHILHTVLRRAGGTHDFDEYIPHLTVTYFAPRDLDLDHLSLPETTLKVKSLKVEPLDLNWKDK